MVSHASRGDLVFFLLFTFAVGFNLSFLNTYMDLLRVGSLNINGGRDRHKISFSV